MSDVVVIAQDAEGIATTLRTAVIADGHSAVAALRDSGLAAGIPTSSLVNSI